MSDQDPKSFHEAWLAEQFAEEFKEERERRLKQAEEDSEAAQREADAVATGEYVRSKDVDLSGLPFATQEDDEPEEPEDPSVVKTYVFDSSDCQITVLARTKAEALAIIEKEMHGHVPYDIMETRPKVMKEGDIEWCWS